MSIDTEAVSPDVETYPVVVTIARDFGAEGHEIGKMLSLELGIPFYDNEVLVRASERAGSSVSDAAAYDERCAAELFAFLPDRMDARSNGDKLFAHVVDVVQELGSQSCIIEGRLSDYILRDNPNRIAVLVTAPLDARIEIVRSKRGWDEKRAKKLVKKMQRGRELFYDRYSKGKNGLHDNKDIVVNRARFGRQGCVDIIAAAYRAKVAAIDAAAGAEADDTGSVAADATAAYPAE